MTDVVALGVAVVDIVASPADKSMFERDNTPVERVDILPGGDAVNQAIALCKLGRGAALSCRVGADALGRMLVGELKEHGVDTAQVVRAPESSSSAAIVLVAQNGQRNILCKRGNNYDFCRDDIDIEAATSARALSVGSIYGMPKLEDDGLLEVLQRAKQKGVLTFADMGSDKKGLKLKGVTPFLPFIDFFMPSETESAHLTDGLDEREAAKAFKAAGANNAVIKLGSRGVYADCEDFRGYVPAFDITPTDTTGAGDAFCAGFIHGMLGGEDVRVALKFASACGAYHSLFMGANTAVFDAGSITKWMQNTPIR